VDWVDTLTIMCTDLLTVLKHLLQDWGILVVTMIYTIFAGLQWRVITRQTRISRDTLVQTHRPLLRVRNVVVRLPTGTVACTELFQPNFPVSGQLYVANIGGTRATIIESHIEVFWNRATLPMERPYEGKVGNNKIPPGTVEAGCSTVGVFSSETILPPDSQIRLCGLGWKIYVMGWITYRDDIGTRRETAFCREWRMPAERFFAVQDRDYEHEE
jgi:hypothetical protein